VTKYGVEERLRLSAAAYAGTPNFHSSVLNFLREKKSIKRPPGALSFRESIEFKASTVDTGEAKRPFFRASASILSNRCR